MVVSSLVAVHTHPKFWSPDPLVWRPSRWISSSATAKPNALSGQIACEQLYSPPKGVYFPWSEGLQNCPGRKYAQVEFSAVLMCLFKSHRVEVVPEKGENVEAARSRVYHVVEDSEQVLLLRMRKADSVRLTWREVQ